MLTRERIRELIDDYGFSERADEIMAQVRPSIHLSPRYAVEDADIPIGASKMGGSPDVPDGFEFPTWNDRCLSFIAQIRLADAKPYDLEGLLPPSGMLYFFYEYALYCEHITQIYYTPLGPYKVIYMEDESVPLHRLPHPVSEYPLTRYANEPLLVQTEVYRACPIEFELEWTARTHAHRSKQHSGAFPASDEQELFWDWWCKAVDDELAAPMHRLLGIETDHQASISTLDYASKAWSLGTEDDWMLLLQLDSDAAGQATPGFQWVDAGLLYFCIPKADLRARRFDRIWLDMTDS